MKRWIRFSAIPASMRSTGNKKEACFRYHGPIAESPIQLPKTNTKQCHSFVFTVPSMSFDMRMGSCAHEDLSWSGTPQ
jgi:hypothetical protein